MLPSLSIALAGLVLGLLHATDADHVVAVTTIVSRQRSLLKASAIGALWGLGHTLTILLVGSAIILLQFTISPRLGLGMEFVVALMLIGLGVYNLTSGAPRPREGSGLRSFAVGTVHGLAGSAAVALLVAARVQDPRWAVLYLLIFGLGTVAGMVLVTLALALPSLFAVTRMLNAERYLRLATGAVSVVFGLMLAHEIGVVNGLFGADPQWDPH